MSALVRPRFGRRAALRGLGGICVTLPFLELFAPRRAAAASPPTRYVVAFGGCSLGIDGIERMVSFPEGALPQGPLDPGNLTEGLKPIGNLGVTDVVSVVSNLVIPWGPEGSVPPGGRPLQWHNTSFCPLLSGVSSTASTHGVGGPTSDWIVADKTGALGSTVQPPLAFRVQAAEYYGSNGLHGSAGMMSARMNDGALEVITPVSSPKLAYETLFSSFTPTSDPEQAAQLEALLRRRRSVVDLVADDAAMLLPQLGAADKLRLQRHFDELRALETRLEAIHPGQAACILPQDPGEDPPIGAATFVNDDDTPIYDATHGYSDEEKRAEVLVDLIHMAFACDLSRVASLLFTSGQSFLNMVPLLPELNYSSDLHGLGHYAGGAGEEGARAMAQGAGWHIRHFSRLVQKLRDTEDVDGSSILDHTGMALVFEGGIGYDPEIDQDGQAHSSENMVAIVAGRAGGLHQQPGRHVRTDRAHPAQVLTTVMEACGAGQQLGEVSGIVDGLIDG